MDDIVLTEDQANAVYDILISFCGAYDDEPARYGFCYYQTVGCREYRFGGKLGFGGKFWNLLDSWSVNCYSEDLTPERQQIIDRTNQALEDLRKLSVK